MLPQVCWRSDSFPGDANHEIRFFSRRTPALCLSLRLLFNLGFECINPRIEERSQACRRTETNLELSAATVSDKVNRSANTSVPPDAFMMRAMPQDAGKAVHLIVQSTIESLAIHEHRAAFKDSHCVRLGYLVLPALRAGSFPHVFDPLRLSKRELHSSCSKGLTG